MPCASPRNRSGPAGSATGCRPRPGRHRTAHQPGVVRQLREHLDGVGLIREHRHAGGAEVGGDAVLG